MAVNSTLPRLLHNASGILILALNEALHFPVSAVCLIRTVSHTSSSCGVEAMQVSWRPRDAENPS